MEVILSLNLSWRSGSRWINDRRSSKDGPEEDFLGVTVGGGSVGSVPESTEDILPPMMKQRRDLLLRPEECSNKDFHSSEALEAKKDLRGVSGM